MSVERVGSAVAGSMAPVVGFFGTGRSFEDLLAAAGPGGPLLELDPAPATGRVAAATTLAGADGSLTLAELVGVPTDASASAAAVSTDTPDASLPPIDEGWIDALPERGRAWSGDIVEAAERHDLDPRVLAAVVWSESGFDPEAVSSAGAIGLAQLMPGTAEGLGVDPWNPRENLDGGARYLAEQLDRFGSIDLALAAYNAGPGRVLDAGGVPAIAETQAYVRIVTDRLRALGGAE